LNKKADYLTQNLANGDLFNIFRPEKTFSFYLLVDLSRCKLWLYYIDHETKEKELLKRYDVGLGRLDSAKPSGSLTPTGTFTLGNNIATYQPNVKGIYLGDKVEMISIFGTRWIPFEKVIGKSSAPAKGYGLHGTPWKRGENNELVDDAPGIGGYESDGCLRMRTTDAEELFAIIITKPSVIEIVKDFHEASYSVE